MVPRTIIHTMTGALAFKPEAEIWRKHVQSISRPWFPIHDIFAAIDSPPKCLQVDPKSVVYIWKMLSPQTVKLAGSLDIRHLSCDGPYLTHYIAAVNRAIPDVFAAADNPPKYLQGDRKSLVYVRKCRHSRRSNLQDRSISALVGKNYLHTGLPYTV